MAPTLSKDRCLAIGIHRAPPHLSPKEFESRTEALVDSIIQLPIAQKNFLKFDIIFQTVRLQEHVLANRLPKPADILLCKAETQTVDHMTEVLNDPAFKQLIAGAEKEFSLQSGACSFSADILTRIDSTSSHGQNDDALSHLICIFKIPPHLTTDEFRPKFKKWVDGFASLPVTKKVVVKHTEWVQNKTLDPQFAALGYPVPDPTFIVHLETRTWEAMLEWAEDEEMRRLITEGKEDFHLDSCSFSADIVAKIDKRSD